MHQIMSKFSTSEFFFNFCQCYLDAFKHCSDQLQLQTNVQFVYVVQGVNRERNKGSS